MSWIDRGTLRKSCIAAAAGLPLLAMLPASASPANALIATRKLPAALAMEAVNEAVTVCARRGYFVTAVIVDTDGVRQAELRGDYAAVHAGGGAYGKAYTAVSLAPIARVDSTAAMAKRVAADPALSGLLYLPDIVLIAGGVTIKVGEEVVAGIGVAGAPGGNNDEECARAGIEKIRDRLK